MGEGERSRRVNYTENGKARKKDRMAGEEKQMNGRREAGKENDGSGIRRGRDWWVKSIRD